MRWTDRFDSFDPVVPCDVESKQSVLLLCPRTNVVDNQRLPRRISAFAHDHDMRKVWRHDASYKVSRLIVLGHSGDGEAPPAPLKILPDVGNPPMVYILIRRFEAPVLWVLRKATLHVVVDEALQVQAQALAQGTHHDVGAYPRLYRHVPVRIREGTISGIVAHGLADLRSRSNSNARTV